MVYSGRCGTSPSLFINNYIKFFIQDMACAVDYNGKLLLEEKGRLAISPNGNGGWFTSMVKAGLDKDLHLKNIKWINIFAVDNVLQRIADPAFLGATCQKKWPKPARPTAAWNINTT